MEGNAKGRQTALIDWFRFTCLWHLDVDHPDPDARKILSLLRVDPERFTLGKNYCGQLQYGKTVTFDEDVHVGLEPKDCSKVHGIADQFIVDLSGSACRHFEERGGSWKDVISYLVTLPVRFNRVDLALDDIDGELDIDSLRRKIADQCFSSAFRARKENGRLGDERYRVAWYEPDDLEGHEPYIQDTRKGYTCQFGARNSGSVCLNIYDKLRERQSKGLLPGVGEWIRFEVSFTGERCQHAVRDVVHPSMERGSFGKAVSGIMRGLIEFKEAPKGSNGNVRSMSTRNINKLPVWRKYRRFLHGAAAIRVPSDQAKVEQTVTRTVRWAKGYWRSSLVRLFGTSENAMGEVVASVSDWIRDGGLTWQVISEMRSYSRSLGQEMTVDQILDKLQSYVDTFGGDVDVRKAFEDRLSKDRDAMRASERFLQELSLGDDFHDDLPTLEEYRRKKAMLDAFDLDGIDV